MLDSHPAMPEMELFQQIGIDLEQVERRGIGQRRPFHETEQQEQVVQLGGLLAQFGLVAAERHAAHELSQMLTKKFETHLTQRPRRQPAISDLPQTNGILSS